METVFISYSHKDEVWKNRLVTQLKVLEIEGFYQSWDDREIEPGSDWFREIETALNRARVVVMLISAHYLTSQFIIEVEVPRILGRRQQEGVTVVPVILNPCAWQKVQWLSSMQMMPKDGAALAEMKPHEIDRELAELAKKVCDLIGRADSVSAAPSHGNPKLGPLVYKMCNRFPQVNDFMKFFLEQWKKCPSRPQFYFIHGDEWQGHEGFLERLMKTCLKDFAEKEWGVEYATISLDEVPWPKEGKLEDREEYLKMNIMEKFAGYSNPPDFTARSLAQD